jgi:hemerythrin-like domain-containing protein
MNALELLKQDHDKVSDLFEDVDDADTIETKREIFARVKSELQLHARIEETIFYPAFQHKEGFEDLIAEAYEEHQEMKDLLADIDALLGEALREDAEEEFEDKFDELVDCVEHHVDEEENELFPRIEETMSEAELEALGARLEQAKGGSERSAA